MIFFTPKIILKKQNIFVTLHKIKFVDKKHNKHKINCQKNV